MKRPVTPRQSDQQKPKVRRDTRRRFEQWAGNPACEANTISAVHGISMTEVALSEGAEPSMGQSPFAIARGLSFERGLFSKGAEKMRDALEKAGVLPQGSTGFADLRLVPHGGPMRDLDQACEATHKLLMALGTDERPTLLASATLLIPSGVMLPEALLVVDVVALDYDDGKVTLTVGEIKTYPDRGGYTGADDLSTARAQAGVYIHALRLVVKQLGLEEQLQISDKGFLVLTRPGSNRPSVRAGEDLHYQAWRAERGFRQLSDVAATLPGIAAEADGGYEVVRNAGTSYCEACVSFCDRAPICYKVALAKGDAVVLGDGVKRFLGSTSLDRAVDLLEGMKPKTPQEEDLAARLKAGGPS